MFRNAKMSTAMLALVVLVCAQVLPASALTVSFTTAAAPIKITSSTIAPNQTGVVYNPTLHVNFSRGINSVPQRNFRYAVTSAAGTADTDVSGTNIGYGSDWIQLNLAGTTLAAGTQYYLEFNVMDTDGNTLDSTDPANIPYYNVGSGTFRLYFTTVDAAGWLSTVVGSTSGATTGGQTSVPITAKIKVKTTAALNGTTVNTTNVVLYQGSVGGTVIAATAALDPADATNQTVLVTPSSNLLYSTTYYLVLSNVQDTLGNVLP